MKHAHRFSPLSDHAVYCVCGEIRETKERCPHHYTGWYWYPYWSAPNYTTPYPYFTLSGTTTVRTTDFGSTTYIAALDGGMSTLT